MSQQLLKQIIYEVGNGNSTCGSSFYIENQVKEVATRYARAVAQRALEKAADKMTTEYDRWLIQCLIRKLEVDQ